MRISDYRPSFKRSDVIPLDRIETLSYVAHEYELHEVASLLKRHGYRGAICGPAGAGKTVLLQALGDELMAHGLSPLTLRLQEDRKQALPTAWRRTIRKARHTDALLLDDYDLLPRWARAWVWVRSMRAGAVVVTTKRNTRFKTLARPKPTVGLLKKLVEQLTPTKAKEIDCANLFEESQGNMRVALRALCKLSETPVASDASSKKQAS